MASDYVVVFSVDDAAGRTGQLVEAIARRGFTVIADADAGGTDAASTFAYDAAAVVIAFGEAATGSPARTPTGIRVGRAVPVKLTPAAIPPDGFAQLDAIDLDDGVDSGRGFDELVRRLSALVDDTREAGPSGTAFHDWVTPLTGGASAVADPMSAIQGLEALTDGVRDVAVLLSDDSEPTLAIRATLDEVGSTYRVVQEAIDSFHAAFRPDELDVGKLATLRGGRLADHVHNGRGHCKRIGARYFAHDGPRSVLQARHTSDAVAFADGVFRQLTNADMDLFDALDSVGSALTLEAREIYTLTISGQDQEACRRFVAANQTLAPLEDALQTAQRRLRDVEQSLGYAHDTPQEAPHVEDRSIHIYGNVTNSMVAQTITKSRVVLQSASLSKELHDDMDKLLDAVGALAATLAGEDSEAMAIEVEQLTREVASEQPKVGVIKKCLRSLEQFGKVAGEVGVPIVTLVAKIIAFF